MVASNSTASPNTYRIDIVRVEQGSDYHVMNCSVVARFKDAEHAAFLVDLLTKGQVHD